MDRTVTAICRNCNSPAPAGEFRIDLDLKIMVCSKCFRTKHPKKEPIKNIVEVEKPPGWDEVDEQLAKKAKEKVSTVIKLRAIGDSDKVRYACRMCDYRFTYNTTRRLPTSCPYCDAKIPNIQVVRQ